MARGGVNKAVVKIARDALLARGARPTIDAVRIELGNTGSKSTILRCLQELTEQETKRPEPSLEGELLTLIGPVADRLREAAHASVAVEREALTRQEFESRAQRQKAQERIQALQQRNTELTAQLQEQRQLELALQSQLQASEVERSRLQELEQGLRILIEERALQVRSLEEKHQHAREALAHYRQSQKEQRTQELHRHDAQLQLLHREVRTLQESLLEKQSLLEGLNRANERLLAEARNQAQQLYLA